MCRDALLGQSMVADVWQIYVQLFPAKLESFVYIDSVPLQKTCNRCRIATSAFHTQRT